MNTLARLERRLSSLVEEGRIVWCVDDAPEIEAELEDARAELSDDCPMCGGPLQVIGAWTRFTHNRCRDCGWTVVLNTRRV